MFKDIWDDEIIESYELYNIETIFQIIFWFLFFYCYFLFKMQFIFIVCFIVAIYSKNNFDNYVVLKQTKEGPLRYIDRYFR